MKERDFADMVIYFCQKVSEMNISRKCKMELLGMITAIEMKHDELMPKWIPVTEALPENNDEVLTTYIVNGNNRKRFVETASYIDGDEGYWSSPWDEYMVRGTRKDVLAWMPLPESYKGD